MHALYSPITRSSVLEGITYVFPIRLAFCQTLPSLHSESYYFFRPNTSLKLAYFSWLFAYAFYSMVAILSSNSLVFWLMRCVEEWRYRWILYELSWACPSEKQAQQVQSCKSIYWYFAKTSPLCVAKALFFLAICSISPWHSPWKNQNVWQLQVAP